MYPTYPRYPIPPRSRRKTKYIQRGSGAGCAGELSDRFELGEMLMFPPCTVVTRTATRHVRFDYHRGQLGCLWLAPFVWPTSLYGGGQAAARCEFSTHHAPHGLRSGDNVFQNSIDGVFVKYAEVSVP